MLRGTLSDLAFGFKPFGDILVVLELSVDVALAPAHVGARRAVAGVEPDVQQKVLVLVAFEAVLDFVSHGCILSEDAEEGKGTKQKTLGFQSLLLLARLDRVLAREDHHETDDDEEDEEGDRLAVHAPIIARSPEDASPCTEKRSENFALMGLLGTPKATYMQGLLLLLIGLNNKNSHPALGTPKLHTIRGINTMKLEDIYESFFDTYRTVAHMISEISDELKARAAFAASEKSKRARALSSAAYDPYTPMSKEARLQRRVSDMMGRHATAKKDQARRFLSKIKDPQKRAAANAASVNTSRIGIDNKKPDAQPTAKMSGHSSQAQKDKIKLDIGKKYGFAKQTGVGKAKAGLKSFDTDAFRNEFKGIAKRQEPGRTYKGERKK